MTPNDKHAPDRGSGPRDLLARLSQVNPTIVVLAAAGLFFGILLLPDRIGAALILLIVAGLAWLLSRTWSVLTGSARLMRLLVIGLLVAVAYLKVTT